MKKAFMLTSYMDHVAVMKKSWRLTEKIISGEKTIETRWYKTKRVPWNTLKTGETIYFKDSGDKISVKAVVDKIEKYSDLTPKNAEKLISQIWKEDVVEEDKKIHLINYAKDKKYCILIYLKNSKTVEPFDINKKGFGMQTAWISVNKISLIKA